MTMRNRLKFALLLTAANFVAPLIVPAQQASGADDSAPQVENLDVNATIAENDEATPGEVRTYRIKFISERTIYIDGGSNSGLRVGMHLDVYHGAVPANRDAPDAGEPLARLHVIGTANASALTEVTSGDSSVQVGDSAVLEAQDAVAAERNLSEPAEKAIVVMPEEENLDDKGAAPVASNALRLGTPNMVEMPRMAGRIGLDTSAITSEGSTKGQSFQVGMLIESDMRGIAGTHWNLEGYWRGRINSHSQFQADTESEVLNKTYTMQLSYENPESKWVAGVGRLYLPWAVSLDTIDGGYVGHKFPKGMTAGVFAGSTPDINSWHYRPNQRIGGTFVNFEGGSYERFHYSSTTGLAMNTIKWDLDRPEAFFENEVSVSSKFSVFHSMIADDPRGYSTDGIRPGRGISHSYFTAHYAPVHYVSFDVYHNFFRDVPTAETRIVGNATVDKLLFQGFSAGAHVRPSRYVTVYGTLGQSAKTGDMCTSLNRMYGATLNELFHSGIRADYHATKFDSNFGYGNYKFLTLSRQMTNHAYWTVMAGDQKLFTPASANYSSMFFATSMDFNIGRHSYLQSGYTYVNGATMNYRQWYMSWGLRLDGSKRAPEFVQTMH
jgi:hypothetical protein